METILITTPSKVYPVQIGHGLLAALNTLHLIEGDAVLITDENIPEHVIDAVRAAWPTPLVIRLSPGESAKTLDTYQTIITKMMAAALSRSTTVIAVGGGCIGDVAGFVAATYHRGVPWVNVPTSLLAMVDASIGGKTALNMARHKNIVGTFHHPDAVFIDPDVLDSLPERELCNGYAELIKAALIHDKTLCAMLLDDRGSRLEHITRAVKVKQHFVEADPGDEHLRHLLNFGHTLGHAFETLYYPTYLHGECVAAGMRQMTRGTALETVVSTLLDRYGLNMSPPIETEKMIAIIRQDKKRRGETLTIARLKALGEGELVDMPFEAFLHYLDKEGPEHV